jgi:hypothetical protein
LHEKPNSAVNTRLSNIRVHRGELFPVGGFKGNSIPSFGMPRGRILQSWKTGSKEVAMNTIIPFKSRKPTTANSLEAEKQTLMVYLKRLARAGETLVQASGHALEDQVLTHALVASGVPFRLVASKNIGRDRSISTITRERYGLSMNDDRDNRDGMDDMVLEARDLLKGWLDEALVQYVLDHEVPVDPADMPGAASLLRLAG